MILGVGTDIVEIKRLKQAFQKSPKMVERIFTLNEKNKAQKLSPQKKLAYYAKRFSGKEALSKAVGTGIGKDIGWQDLEILNNGKGAPVATFSQKGIKFLQKKFKTKKVNIFISLSDEKGFAIAFCVLEK